MCAGQRPGTEKENSNNHGKALNGQQRSGTCGGPGDLARRGAGPNMTRYETRGD
jgi:hypothetical protein